jgi:hypothetical protein
LYNDDIKDSFYEELGRDFDQFPRYDMKIILGDFNAKVSRKNISKPTIGKESLHEISNDKGVRVINIATSKNFVLESTKFINTPGPLLRERQTTTLITF